jgi:hypothetical protein
MEKQLMDKMLRHELDDIDKEMITARLKVAHRALRVKLDAFTEALEGVSNFCKEHSDEVKLLNFRLCVTFDDDIIHCDSTENDCIPVLCALGSPKELHKLTDALNKAIDS